MQSFFKNIIYALFILCIKETYSFTSLVYNFRIAQITKHPIFSNDEPKCSLLSVIFEEYQRMRDTRSENYTGGLVSLLYNFDKKNYFRMYGALSSVIEKYPKKTTFSNIETDDILFNGGHNFKINKKSTVTVSGFFGIPTHKLIRLSFPSVGYGQFGLGAQVDTLYEFTPKDSVYSGLRYIYFIPRNTTVLNKNYKLSPGDLYDFLIGYRRRFARNNIETGYALKVNNDGKVTPYNKEIIERIDFAKSYFYLVFKHKFKSASYSSQIIIDFTYGFQHSSKPFSNKYTLSSWWSWNVDF